MSLHKETTGRSLHEPAQYHVENQTGSLILKGTVVKRAGYGNFLRITPVTDTADEAFGVVVDDIADGDEGYVARGGIFGQFNTSSWPSETALYKDASGALTDTVAGKQVATVLVSDTLAGRLFITLDDGPQGPSGPTGPAGTLNKWVSGTSYSVDEVVWYDGDNTIYRCNTANSDVSFTPAKWDALSEETAPVDSIFGRTGAVTAQTGDYTWAQIDKSTSSLADITTRAHSALTGIGTNTHSQIDSHLASKKRHVDKWSSGTSYLVDDLVWYDTDKRIYRCKTANSDVSFTPAKWDALSSSAAPVDSVHGRTGAVTAQSGDYTWNQLDKSTSSIADITTRNHSDLSGIGSNSHTQIDSHIGDGNRHIDKWVGSTSYVVDDVIWYEGDDKIYRCTVANSDASFTPGNWQELSVEAASGTIFERSGDNVTNSGGTYASDDFTFGGSSPDDTSNGSKFAYDKSKVAWMCGNDTAGNWALRGNYSVNFGDRNISAAVGGVIFGELGNVVSGANFSFSTGKFNTTRGVASFVSGQNCDSGDENSFVHGSGGRIRNTSGGGNVLFALGKGNGANTHDLNEANVFAVMGGPIKLPTFTVATLPPVTEGGFIFVSDEVGGAVTAFCDGTNWRRTTDRAVVS